MLKEVCVENFTDVPKMIERGADRIELNDNMAAWGTTASVGVMKQTVAYCHKKKVPVIMMIRPRGGDFHYNDIEKKMMKDDLETVIEVGADGIAIGALTVDFELDKPFLTDMINRAKEAKIEVTFHRAFDDIPFDKQADALAWLADQGFTRVSVHGGSDDFTIEETLPRLKELFTWDLDIILMIAGGVRKDNIESLAKKLPFKEAHGTRIV